MIRLKDVVNRLMLLLIGGMGLSCSPTSDSKSSTNQAPAPISVTVSKVEKRSIQRIIPLVGTLYGYEELNLAPKVDGRVMSIRHDVADVVIPGTPLLELDDTDYRLEVEAQRRALDAELARLGIQQLPAKDEFDPLTVPLVRRAEVAFNNARSEYIRAKALAEKSVTSNREYEAAEMDYRVAEATRNDARTQAQALYANAQHRLAMLNIAEQRLADTKLVTPIPYGWSAWSSLVGPAANPMKYHIAARYISEGEMVRSMPVTNAFRIVLDHTLKLKVSVSERYMADLRIGLPVTLSVDAYPSESFSGTISRINPTVDIATRTFQTEINVSNLNGRLKSGSFARAFVQTRKDQDVMTVPARAVMTFAGVTKVFVFENGRARAVPVSIGTRSSDWVEVIGLIDQNMQVITSGLSQIVDGSSVEINS